MPQSPTGPLTIRKVENAADSKIFFEFPWTIYKGDPNWVPPLLSTRHGVIDKDKNPGWDYMIGDYFVAFRGSTPVGTIAAVVKQHHQVLLTGNIRRFGIL